MPERGQTGKIGGESIFSALSRSVTRTGLASMVVTSLIVVVTASPTLLGTWFPVFSETRDGAEIFRLEVQVTGWTLTRGRTADLGVQVRATNSHSVDIHITTAHFTIRTFSGSLEPGGEVVLRFVLEDLTVPSGATTAAVGVAHIEKILGTGVRFLVEGSIVWEDIFPPPDPRGTVPHAAQIRAVHSITDLIPPL